MENKKLDFEKQAINSLRELADHPSLPDTNVKFRLFSIYGALLESKNLFPNNPDIRELTNLLPLSRPIKNYLLKARPQIIARLITEILKMDHDNLMKLVSKTLLFVMQNKEISQLYNKNQKNISKKEVKKDTNYIDSLLNKYSRGTSE